MANSVRATGFSMLVLVAACQGTDDPTGLDTTSDEQASGTLLSAPVPRSSLERGGAGSGSLVFVASPPGSLPDATRATVVGEGGDSALAVVRDGGFDPLPVAGSEGRTLRLLVTDSSGRTTAHALSVKGRVPPRVVRTAPAPQQSDVPLNTRLGVTFTTPIAQASRTGVHLLSAGRDVTGTVQFSPDGLQVDFVPDARLSANTSYELRVDADVRDVLGSPLGAPVRVPFVTGTTDEPVFAVDIAGFAFPWQNSYVNYVRLEIGQTIALQSFAIRVGTFASRVPTRWSSSNPGVLRVTEQSPGVAFEQGVAEGEAVVRAEIEGHVAEIRVRVGPLPPGIADAHVWVERGPGVWRESVLGGSDRYQVLGIAQLPADGTLCDGRLGPRCYFPEHEFAATFDGRIAVTRLSDIGGVWVKDAPGAVVRRVNAPAERGAAHGPAWSLDGSRLAYWFDFFSQAVTELRVVNRDGSEPRVLLRTPYDTTYRPSPGIMDWATRRVGGAPIVWHADGRRLLMATPEGTLQVPVDGSAASLYLAGLHPGPWFADGRTQYVTSVQRLSTDNPPRFQVFRADAAGVVDLASEFHAAFPPIAISPDGRLVANWGYAYPVDRSEYFEVTGYEIEHVLGFAR